MRSKVALSGAAYFACVILVAAIASPTLLNILARSEAKEAISPFASFSIPNIFDGDISPDGQRIAVATSNGIEIRNLTDGRLERRLGQARTDRVSWSPDGEKVAAIDEENLYVWDLASSAAEPSLCIRIRMQSPVCQPEWFPDSKRIATITQDGPLLIHDTDTGKTLHRLDPPKGYSFCNALSISPSSVIAAACFEGHNGLLVLWNSTTYEEISTRPVNTTSDPPGAEPSGYQLIRQLAWSPNGTVLSYLVANWPGTRFDWFRLELWKVDPTSPEQESWVVPIKGNPYAWMHSYAWSPTGNSIAYIRNMSHTLGIYSLADGHTTERGIGVEQEGVGNYNRLLGFSPDGKTLAVYLQMEVQIQVFDADDLETALSLNQYGWWIEDAAISPDGKSIVALNVNGRAVIFNLSSRRIESVFKTPALTEGRISFSQDGQRILVCSEHGISVWDRVMGVLETGWDLNLSGSVQVFWTASDLSPDGAMVAFLYVGTNNTLQALELRRVADGELIARKDLPPGPGDLGQTIYWEQPVKWSPDQQEIAFTDHYSIFIWNLSSGEIVQLGVQTNASSLTWHPKLPLLLSGGKGAILWDVPARQPVLALDRTMYRPIFSPDGAMICDGGTIYNSTTFEAVYVLESPKSSYASSWSPYGKHIVTVAPSQGLVNVYELPPQTSS